MKRALFAALFFLSGTTAFAQTDVVLFANGDRLSGTVLGMSQESLRFQTDSVGAITIPLVKITQVTHNGEVVPLSVKEVNAEFRTPSNVPGSSRDSAQQASEEQSKGYPCNWTALNKKGILVPSQWRFNVGTGSGLTWLYATQSQQNLGGSLELEFCEKTRLNTTTLLLSGTHTRSSKIGATAITGDVADFTLTQTHFLFRPGGAALYALGDGFLNNSLGLVLQRSFGAGFQSRPFVNKSESVHFTAFTDLRYINQRFYGITPDQNLTGLRVGQDAGYEKKAFAFFEEASVTPAFNDVHALQAFARGGPTFQLSPWLCIGFTEEEHYLGNAPPGHRKNYLASTANLSLQHRSTAPTCKL